ncbi:WD40 repeat domain-containing protein [Parafrankia sp. FMc2]
MPVPYASAAPTSPPTAAGRCWCRFLTLLVALTVIVTTTNPDPASVSLVGEPLTGHTDVVESVAFSPDGKTLSTASADRTVRLWRVE